MSPTAPRLAIYKAKRPTFGPVFLVVLIVSIYVFAYNRRMHDLALDHVEASEVMRSWEHEAVVDVLMKYAPLPYKDKALVEQRCRKTYNDIANLRGTLERLPARVEPICQALIRGGWTPKWTVHNGLSVYAKNRKERHSAHE